MEFNIITYFEKLKVSINNILDRPEKIELTYDILDTEKTKLNKLIVLKEKQRQMKIGEIWQEVLGTYDSFTNLKVGHVSGLDILSEPRKIIIELKNRTNTDNASSKKSNLNKLAEFKKKNMDYTCIYGNINDTNEKSTLNGSTKILNHNGVEIKCLIGMELLKLILGNDTYVIIDFVKEIIDKHYNNA